MAESSPPRNWKDITPSEDGGFLREPGTYVFLVEEAWDSLCSLPGTYDYEKRPGPSSRYIGLQVKVVGPEKSPQIGKYFTIELWGNTEPAQERTLAALERMKAVLGERIEPDEPMSVSEICGQYLRATVDEEHVDDSDKTRLKCKPWNIGPPGEGYENQPRELFVDTENEMSIKHYEKELERLKKKASVDDEDLPF